MKSADEKTAVPKLLDLVDKVEIPDDSFTMWTVYDHPSDFPDAYVARLSMTVKGPGNTVVTGHTPTHLKSESLDDIRHTLRMLGKIQFQRNDGDPPIVVETWL